MNINQFRAKFNNENTMRNDLSSVVSSYATVPGRIPVNAAGEARATINFPVKFTSQPSFTFGLELQEGEGTIPGQRPSGSVYVERWITQERLPSTIFYVGADVVGVLDGLPQQKLILNVAFSGVALSNPS